MSEKEKHVITIVWLDSEDGEIKYASYDVNTQAIAASNVMQSTVAGILTHGSVVTLEDGNLLGIPPFSIVRVETRLIESEEEGG